MESSLNGIYTIRYISCIRYTYINRHENPICILAFRFYQREAETGKKIYFESPQVQEIEPI